MKFLDFDIKQMIYFDCGIKPMNFRCVAFSDPVNLHTKGVIHHLVESYNAPRITKDSTERRSIDSLTQYACPLGR